MKNQPNAKLLRIFIGENDKYKHQPFYETIVFEAKKQGLSGATVTRGIMGFGANSKTIHTSKLIEISSDLPLVIEIVDYKKKIYDFVKTVEALFKKSGSGGMITIENAEVIRFKSGEDKS
ncbi:MAG: DUF190 domain-containing protein [Bacteroidales bacterium]